MRRLAALLVGLVPIAAGCAHASEVSRAYDGRVVQGRYIEPVAYAAFLRGAVAEAAGDAAGAAAAYDDAARSDPDGPEIWTRLGEATCARDPGNRRADADFVRARSLDPDYARVWLAEARCQLARGDVAGARRAAVEAAREDPTADGATVLLARTASPEQQSAARAGLLSLTLTAGDRAVAWRALADWSRVHDDVALWALALRRLARLSPAHREEAAAAAEELQGRGEIGEARALAAAAADASDEPLSSRHPLAARLAVDEAIGQGDARLVTARATRVRVGREEAAGRALLAGRWSLAQELARTVAQADPAARGARWVLAAAPGGDVVAATFDVGPAERPSAATFVAFGLALERAISPERARTWLSSFGHAPAVAGDDLVVRPAVELVMRGALGAGELPPDGAVELAALRGEAPSPRRLESGADALDARHRFLGLALVQPQSASARQLARTFAGSTGAGDPIVVAASALMQLAGGSGAMPVVPAGLLARDPADPLLAAVALRLAEKDGDHEAARRARTALSAMGEPAKTLE